MASPSTSRYEERAAPAELHDLLTCGWRQQVGADVHVQRVVPDGCIDLIWRAGRSLVVAGPATEAVMVELPGGTSTVGVRFRPGAGAAFLGVPLSELRDGYASLEELWSGDGGGGDRRGGGARRPDVARRLSDSLAGAASDEARLALLSDTVLALRRRAAPGGVDPIVTAAARRLVLASPATTVAALGGDLGVSERQLLRRFRTAVGYGPKTLARVLRFQRFLAAAWGPAAATSAWSPEVAAAGPAGAAPAATRSAAAVAVPSVPADRSLARLALDAGYADQAHLTRECRALAGVPPSVLLRGA